LTDPVLYWEWHFKVSIQSCNDLSKLKIIIQTSTLPFTMGLSMGIYSHTHFPIITLRLWKGSAQDAIRSKDMAIAYIKSHGFHVDGKIQAEHAIYDTNSHLDDGWAAES
jgi:hypothetical protein